MNWAINLVGKLAGVSGWLSKSSPLLLAGSALLAALSHILGQAGANPSTADTLALLKSLATSTDGAVIALSFKSIINHFRHEKNATALSEDQPKE